MFPPERIICLTEETVETLYLLGEESRIGISGYVVRPPRARREKPRVSAFTSADIPKILDLKPDLVRLSPIFKPISRQRSFAPMSACTRSINAPSRKFST
jgi:ABC-type Fe3+-hydroxamate transport system substrate-binding protein